LLQIEFVAAAILFAAAMVALIASSVFTNRMIAAINRQGERMSAFGLWPMKVLPVLAAYRRLYPGGTLDGKMTRWGTLGLIMFAISCALLVHIILQA
jgi:hypothetical protein